MALRASQCIAIGIATQQFGNSEHQFCNSTRARVRRAFYMLKFHKRTLPTHRERGGFRASCGCRSRPPRCPVAGPTGPNHPAPARTDPSPRLRVHLVEEVPHIVQSNNQRMHAHGFTHVTHACIHARMHAFAHVRGQ